MLVQAVVLLPLVRVALKVVTIGRLQLGGSQPTKEAAGIDSPLAGPSPEAIARLVRIAAERGPYRAKCLEQSLVLRWLLLQRGIDARIVFGARKQDEEIQAHAWVEVNGIALSEDNGAYQDFAPLDELLARN